MAGLAAIETTEQIMDRLRLSVAQLGIATIRKLQMGFSKVDKKETGIVANEEFLSVLMKNSLFLSKIESSNIIKTYKVDELNINYAKFMEQLCPKLSSEREEKIQQLFDLIRENTKQTENIIFYRDLMSLCDFKNHPSVQSGQFSEVHARDLIQTAFNGIQNDKDEITPTQFMKFFQGISCGYPYNKLALFRFLQDCWHEMFQYVNNGNFNVEEANKYVEQIEAMLAEKTRQKIKGMESENSTLLRQFKFFDTERLEYLNYAQFVRTLESFSVLAPEKEMTMLFDKWCNVDGDKKKLFYRPFITKLFEKY